MLFLLGLFLSIFYDFHLQGILSKMKQKCMWMFHGGELKGGRYDYIVALIIHSFEWSFFMMIPIMLLGEISMGFIWVFLIISTLLHAWMDSLKCNSEKVSLLLDQVFHFFQTSLVYLFYSLLKA